jgi:hypothetical protein
MIILAPVVLLLSCKKGDETPDNTVDPTVPQDTCKISQIIFTPQLGGGSYGFIQADITYNNNNISQITYPGNGKILFTYDASNHLIRKAYYFAGNPQIMESHTYTDSRLYPLPSQQWINSVDSNFYSGFFQPTGSTVFRYNGLTDSNVVTQITSNNSNVDFKEINLTWANGDPVSITFNDPSLSSPLVTNITYDVTKVNKFSQVFRQFMFQGIGNSGELFDGYSKYMLFHFISKHMVTSVASSGAPYYELAGNFTYTYNSKGLVKETKLNGVTILTFSYTCD